MADEKLTVKELSEYLQLPVETVYKYVRAGRLPAEKEGAQWVFKRSEVDLWMLEHQNVVQGASARRILVVEDEAPARELMKRWLTSAGYEVVVALDGVEGEDYLKREDFDLLLTDLQMPRMDGAELLHKIQDMEARPAIVVVTAYYDGELMRKVMELGTFRLIKKPANRESVLEIVKSVVG